MSRKIISPETRQEIIKLSKTMSYRQIATSFDLGSNTISKIVRGISKKPVVDAQMSELKRREAKSIPNGCFNVYERDWALG